MGSNPNPLQILLLRYIYVDIYILKGGLFFEDDIDELEVLVAEYDGELSSPSSPLVTMNFMEPIENMHEDNLPMVLEVFQEDAFLDIKKQCNPIWFDLVDGTWFLRRLAIRMRQRS